MCFEKFIHLCNHHHKLGNFSIMPSSLVNSVTCALGIRQSLICFLSVHIRFMTNNKSTFHKLLFLLMETVSKNNLYHNKVVLKLKPQITINN